MPPPPPTRVPCDQEASAAVASAPARVSATLTAMPPVRAREAATMSSLGVIPVGAVSEDRTSSVQTRTPSRKAKATRRMKWTNDMAAALLHLRFEDGEARRKLDTADTKVKKAIAWQFFASVLSERLDCVLTSEQVSTKYRKVKCEFRKRKREMHATGNNPIEQMDEIYWGILNDAFSSRLGISNGVMFDSNLEEPNESEREEDRTDSGHQEPKEKNPPLVQLASAMQAGMEAIAESFSARATPSSELTDIIARLDRQHAEIKHLQERQIELLAALARHFETASKRDGLSQFNGYS